MFQQTSHRLQNTHMYIPTCGPLPTWCQPPPPTKPCSSSNPFNETLSGIFKLSVSRLISHFVCAVGLFSTQLPLPTTSFSFLLWCLVSKNESPLKTFDGPARCTESYVEWGPCEYLCGGLPLHSSILCFTAVVTGWSFSSVKHTWFFLHDMMQLLFNCLYNKWKPKGWGNRNLPSGEPAAAAKGRVTHWHTSLALGRWNAG